MTNEQRDELRKLYEQATQGVWTTGVGTNYADVESGGMTVVDASAIADARLISAIHAALPRLLAESEELERRNDRQCGCGDVVPPCSRCRLFDDPTLDAMGADEAIDCLKRQSGELRTELAATKEELAMSQQQVSVLERERNTYHASLTASRTWAPPTDDLPEGWYNVKSTTHQMAPELCPLSKRLGWLASDLVGERVLLVYGRTPIAEVP